MVNLKQHKQKDFLNKICNICVSNTYTVIKKKKKKTCLFQQTGGEENL